MGEAQKKSPLLAQCVLNVISGPHKGDSYEMVSSKVSIGRSKTNDICLSKDHKVSRQHLEISLRANQIWVKNSSSNNSLYVNGQKTEGQPIFNGSTLQLGTTKIQMVLQEKPQGIKTYGDPHSLDSGEPFDKPPKKERKTLLFLLCAAALVVGYFVLEKPKDPISPQEVEEKSEVITETGKKEEEAEEKVVKSEFSKRKNVYYRQAQRKYIRGFRDYRQGQYEKALFSFEACLAIFPQHELCNTYKRRSGKKLDELIQYQINLGKKYSEQRQHRACVATLRNVMLMIKDRSSRLYKDTRKLRSECEMEITREGL